MRPAPHRACESACQRLGPGIRTFHELGRASSTSVKGLTAVVQFTGMDIQQANDFLRRERARWPFAARDVSDAELMNRRERLFNGLTMAFALIALVSFFWVGILGWGVWGWYVCVVGAVVAARQCSAHADRCRKARQILQDGKKSEP